ncbi:hypothetical protein GCM10028799_13450 [Kribbella italica]
MRCGAGRSVQVVRLGRGGGRRVREVGLGGERLADGRGGEDEGCECAESHPVRVDSGGSRGDRFRTGPKARARLEPAAEVLRRTRFRWGRPSYSSG